nr:transposase [Streptomyces sp. 846.5]
MIADCGYGDEFRPSLREAGLPFVMTLKPQRVTWARVDEPHTPIDAADALTWTSIEQPGQWTAVARTFHDRHTETWWAAETDQPTPARRPRRSRPPVRTAPLGRPELQTSQGRTRLGRLPCPLRPGDPPPPDPGQLRILVLLGHLVRLAAREPDECTACGWPTTWSTART